MPFVADDLGAWLVGLLADAGRKKLTALVLGSDQDRALRQAASAAVWVTAEETSAAGSEQAQELAMVISQVFGEPVPDAPPTGPATLLEELRAGIAAQLAVLDDADLTGVGKSSAGVLGVRGAVLADSLAGHLVQEIRFRGSRGGPLTPLADQLNHDLTHLQGQRLEGMLAQLAGEVRDARAGPVRGAMAGRPVEEVTDPFAVEVHRPMQLEEPAFGMPVLPAYVPREHDVELARVVRAAIEGSSGIAVLVGGSSTGKTRACWEALQLLREQEPGWRLWHPIDPSRPDAALRELAAVGPRTVVWLNEAQFYLDVADGLGERIAAGLRELLRDPARAPVLVLATLWPQFWDGLTARPAGGADPHAQARELLAGRDITVPATFTAAQLRRLPEAGDARLTQAAEAARDGEVIQYLAGAPELLARYRYAPPAAAALIRVAMDARRLGMGIGLPQVFLEAAAPWYLTDAEWEAEGEAWLEQALAYTAVPCKGVRGPLTRIRPHPARSGATGPGSRNGDAQLADGPRYRLADYLDQYGRHHRQGQVPPTGFWLAAAYHAGPSDQVALGAAAAARGLYRYAAQLYKNAAGSGNLRAVLYLSDPPHYLRADVRPMRWAVAHAPLDDPATVAGLLDSLRAAGADEPVTALLHRDPAVHVGLDEPAAVARLLDSLAAAGVEDQVRTLAERAAGRVPVRSPGAVSRLLNSLRSAGMQVQVIILAGRAIADAPLDDPSAVSSLVKSLRAIGDRQVTALLQRDPAAHVWLDDPTAVGELLNSLRAAGADQQAAALAGRAAAESPVDDTLGVTGLLAALREPEAFTVLAERAIAQVPRHDPAAVAGLLVSLRGADAQEQITALLQQDPAAHASLHDLRDVTRLLGSLRVADADQQAAALAQRAAAHAPLDHPRAVSRLLDSLREAGMQEQITTLLHRDPAAHASVGNIRAVTWLLDSLRAAGAEQQAAALAGRAAASAPLDDPDAVTRLLDALREAGADQQASALASRAAAHAPLDNPHPVAWLLDSLREAGMQEQITTLLHRNPAAHASLENPRAVAALLDRLRQAGVAEQVTALLHRDPAAHATLHHADGVIRLMNSLREAGAEDLVTALIDRLPGAGMFELFRQQEGRRDRFRFGREAGGSPAGLWGWEDLG